MNYANLDHQQMRAKLNLNEKKETFFYRNHTWVISLFVASNECYIIGQHREELKISVIMTENACSTRKFIIL